MSYYKQGANYGIGQQTTTQIDADLTFLRQHFDYIRISYPNFDSTSVPYWQDVCLRAKAKGFYVMWGITCNQASSKDWFKFMQKFIDLSAWAASNSVILGMNEEMYHNDTAVIPDDMALRDIHAAARIAKLNNPTVKLAISLAGDGEIDTFINGSGTGVAGRGAFDFVCLNQYGSFADHQANITKLTNAYGTATRVTEFSTGRGFEPLYGTEASWKADIKARADSMQASQVGAFYFYTYYHNDEMTAGTPPVVKWDLRTNANNVSPATHHDAWDLFKKV